ncbi:MAG: DNA repair protein RecN [Pseudomonadota bacterium]
MISALTISNFVLIERLDLEAGQGFTGLTGETGAGKSIILDAIGLIVGARPEKRFVRSGASRAVVVAAFEPPADHRVWQELDAAGVESDPAETLVIKRMIPSDGPARAYINDQPVASALLSMIGEHLVEIHGQHASAHLRKPSAHLEALDRFAGNEKLLKAYGRAWQRLKTAQRAREAIEEDVSAALAQREDLIRDLADLDSLAPLAGEAKILAAQRQQLSQSGRIRDALAEVADAFASTETAERAGWATGILKKLTHLPGFEEKVAAGGLGQYLLDTVDAFDRATIELDEAMSALTRLADLVDGDDGELEQVEGRLFAMRAAGRKHGVDADDLPSLIQRLRRALDLSNAGSEELERVRREEADAAARWRSAANALSKARKAAAGRLEKTVRRELIPLKLEKVSLRVRINPLEEAEADGRGLDGVTIEVETNPGAGFGPLHKIASGGELARISLALKCAAAEALESSSVLIFDEADQGVGGAVAAAIGERLQVLAKRHQVFAVTHSPQVAASAEAHWRIEKSTTAKSLGQMQASVLDAGERTEEIARMLSGAKVTKEARAAAQRLLEG